MKKELTRQQYLDLYYYMRLNRAVEDTMVKLFRQNKIVGGLYSSLGQEGISVGTAYALETGRYFENIDGRVDEWLFSAAAPAVRLRLRRFRVPIFHRPLAWWLNAVVESGFQIERLAKPYADEATAARVPRVADTHVAPYFFHVRCRKPIPVSSAEPQS